MTNKLNIPAALPILARWIILNWTGWVAGVGLTLAYAFLPSMNEDHALIRVLKSQLTDLALVWLVRRPQPAM